MRICWRVGGWGGCRGRRRTARIVCTRRTGRIPIGPPTRCGGAGRDGAVTWQPPSTPTVWPPGQVFAPRTLQRRPHPAGLWNHRGDRLAVGRWDDPSLDTHREQVRYNDYRCSVPARSGLEGATLRWHGHTNQSEPDTAPPCVNEPPDAGQLWGGLIGYKPSYTTSACKESSGARPSGDAPRKQISAKQKVMGRGPPLPEEEKVDSGEDATTKPGLLRGPGWGPDAGWVGSDLARRFGWHVAEQAALEVDRVVRLGRPVRNRQKPRHPFRPLLRPTPTMPPTTPRRLWQHPPQPAPRTTTRRTTRNPKPHTTTVPRPDRYQLRTRLPDLAGRFL